MKGEGEMMRREENKIGIGTLAWIASYALMAADSLSTEGCGSEYRTNQNPALIL